MKNTEENSRCATEVKVVKKELVNLVRIYENRMIVANKSDQTIRNYVRGLVKLYEFHDKDPKELELDQVIDFLVFLKNDRGLNWRTIKLYVASLRYYYQEILENASLAGKIPYPKEKPSLPLIISREELQLLFDSCINYKHKVMFRLLYSCGIRRSELIHLKIHDIETKDGKMRIRINKGKGSKDRYTILSNTILDELRRYFKMCKPKIYLFNGRLKGAPMSSGGVRHAFVQAHKKSGINKPITMHTLRHCFASHALEDGLNIKTLQHLLGHHSIQTTLIYLHISDTPLSKAFSPLDNWSGFDKE